MRVSPVRAGMLSLILTVAAAGETPADLIRLENGGEIRGRIDRTHAQPGQIRIETLSGAVVVVREDDVGFVTRRPLLIEEYETRARRVEDTVDAQWELAEWCRTSRLRDQRREHLLAVVRLDPEHTRARQALGHVRRDGRWVDHAAEMEAQGYVKHQGRYITLQELELLQKDKAERDREKEWTREVRLWCNWLKGPHEGRRQQAINEFRNLTDPDAVPALTHFLSTDASPEIRRLYVATLSRIGGPKVVPPLVRQSLFDIDMGIRGAALNGLAADQYDAAIPLYVKELRNETNEIVRIAGAALGRIGDPRVVPDLINALVTSHRHKVVVPDNEGINVSVRADGSGFGTASPLPPDVELALRAGQLPQGVIVNQPGPVRTRTVTVSQEYMNVEVLDALRRLTGQNFGYDLRTWRLWWASQQNSVPAASR